MLRLLLGGRWIRKGWWEALLRMGPGPGLRWDGMCKGIYESLGWMWNCVQLYCLQGWWWKTENKVCQFSLRICHFLRVALTLSCGQGRGSFPRIANCTSLPGSAPNNTLMDLKQVLPPPEKFLSTETLAPTLCIYDRDQWGAQNPQSLFWEGVFCCWGQWSEMRNLVCVTF